MKLQRYAPVGRDGNCYPDFMTPRDDGDFVRSDEAQAEIDALHAECDRLTEILGPQKVLEAIDVTKSGLYGWRENKNNVFRWVMVRESIHYGMRMKIIGEQCENGMRGQFVGPIKMPEA